MCCLHLDFYEQTTIYSSQLVCSQVPKVSPCFYKQMVEGANMQLAEFTGKSLGSYNMGKAQRLRALRILSSSVNIGIAGQ